jgi:adenosylhomocysteine nucleosidase
MKIGLIVAMQKELRLLLPLMENLEEIHEDIYTIYKGNISGHDVALMQCGIGKVNAALTADFLIRFYSPDVMINSGVAGGADPSMHVLDLFVAKGVAYHDVWCGPGTEHGAAAGFPTILPIDEKLVATAEKVIDNANLKTGLICSGDIFVSKAEEVKSIKSHFPEALAIDMESGALAQVCALRKVPFGVIRVISDTPGEAENISQYENFWTDAPQETFEALKSLLTALK